MKLEGELTVTCPYCGRRNKNRVDDTYDPYEHKHHISIICSHCHRWVKYEELNLEEEEIMKDKSVELGEIIFPMARGLTHGECINLAQSIIKKGWNNNTDLIGKSAFTYEIDDNQIQIYEDKIFAVGKDFAYINDDKLKDEAKILYFKDFGSKWFTNREQCKAKAIQERNNID